MSGLRAWTVVLLCVAAAALAGCTQTPDKPTTATTQRPALAAGKGAIQGLLVDDRYRPLHLTDSPTGPYDAKGFILVVETGATVASDTEGVFQVVDLDPGTFTLKPAVDGHEGAPIKVDVAAGKYAEVDVLVRRLFTPAKDTVIVHDDTVLITCSVEVLDGQFTVGTLCYGDLSSDASNNFVDYNYSQVGNISAVVVEIKFSKVGDYETWLTQQVDLIGPMYNESHWYGVDYGRVQMKPGDQGYNANTPFDPHNLRVWAMVSGPGTQETQQLTGIAMGVGFEFVVKARIVTSAFLTVPDNLDTYSILG